MDNVKITTLFTLNRQTLGWDEIQPTLATTMVGREPSFGADEIKAKLIKSPWGSYIEQEQDDGYAKFYYMDASCDVQEADNRYVVQQFYLEKLLVRF